MASTPDALPRYIQRLGRRVHGRQGHVRRQPQRLVQRAQHLLPGLGPAGARAGHRAGASCYPLGEGLLAFSTLEEAVAGVEAIRARSPRAHAAAARELAEEHFDSDQVLARLLDRWGGRGMTTVVVSGAVANKHRHGGSMWVRMSWAEALRELGFDVLFVEQLARRRSANPPRSRR